MIAFGEIFAQHDENANQRVQFVLINARRIVVRVHHGQTVVDRTQTFETFAEKRFVNSFHVGFQLRTDVRVDFSDQLDASIGHFVRTVDDQFPQIFDANQIFVVHQSDRSTFLLQFIRLGVDGFEEAIETTANETNVRRSAETSRPTSSRDR